MKTIWTPSSVGEFADIRLNAYPDRVFKGRIDNILPILDPSIRTAKVRLEVENPGLMRIGMFVTATFYGKQPQVHRRRPGHGDSASARSRLGLHPDRLGHFQRQEVVTGATLPGNQQEIVSGIKPGQQVVSNALPLQNTVEQ